MEHFRWPSGRIFGISTLIGYSVSVACVTVSCFPWSRPFAPPAPLPLLTLQFCSPASQLLWQSLTSRVCTSSATAPRLPDAGQPLTAGQTRDLPVPVQGACTHARFYDHAGSAASSNFLTQHGHAFDIPGKADHSGAAPQLRLVRHVTPDGKIWGWPPI